MELGCVPEENSSHWDREPASRNKDEIRSSLTGKGMNILLNGSLRLFFSRGRMPAAVLLSPWQTGSHDFRRTYCKAPLATPECWCPEKRRLGAEEGARKELQDSFEQRAPPGSTTPVWVQHVASSCCWPGRPGGRGQLCSSWTGICDSQSLCPAACTRQTNLNWCTQLGQACCQYTSASFLRHQRSRAKATTEYRFNHGRRCSPAALLGDSHCPPATWWAASKFLLCPLQSARAVAQGPLDYRA